MQQTIPLIILDRDGVINEDSDAYIKSPSEWIPVPHSPEAIALFNSFGIKIAVATNQSGLARGFYSEATLDLIHYTMQETLAKVNATIDSIFYCPHGPDDNCICRKPKPGLLKQISQFYQCQLKDIPFVGDSMRDLEAAAAVGCLPVLVKTGKGKHTWEKYASQLPSNTLVFDNLMAFAQYYTSKYNEKSAPLV